MTDSSRILHYFPTLTQKQQVHFAALPELYAHWNAQINVISRKDQDELMERHVLHSLSIAKFITFTPGTIILDIGTGGGFPGIPLAILFDQVQFMLVDSIGKKIKVVNEISQALGLTNVKTRHARAESLTEEFDFALTRAVAPLAELKQWLQGRITRNHFNTKRNGLIALKGGDLTEEIKQSGLRAVETCDLSRFYTEPFFETKQIVYAPLA